jgi:hypothetical protein
MLDQRVASALLVVSPGLLKMIQEPEKIRRTLVEKAVSEGNIPMAMAVLRMDFPAICARMRDRAGEVLGDVFEDDEIDKLCEISRSSAFSTARASEELVTKAVMDIIKSASETSKAAAVVPGMTDLLALKEYLVTASGIKRSGFNVGDEVILGRHDKVKDDENWCHAMGEFVGKRARIIKLSGFDGQGCEVSKVDADGGDNHWRTQNMTRANNKDEENK